MSELHRMAVRCTQAYYVCVHTRNFDGGEESFTQLTKTRHLAARMGGDGVADFHVAVGHENPINRELHQSPLLFKRRVS